MYTVNALLDLASLKPCNSKLRRPKTTFNSHSVLAELDEGVLKWSKMAGNSMWRKNWSFLQSIPSNPFSMLNTPLEMLSYRTTPSPPTAQLLGMTILAPMEYGLLPGSLCVHPAPTVSGSLWWIVWELPGNWIPSISMCLDSLQAFNMFVFALFSDMANSHDDLDSLNSFVLHAFPRCWGAVMYCSLNPI